MKAIVLVTFVDKFGVQHREGDSIEIPEKDRASNLASRKIINVVEETIAAESTTKKTTRKAVKNAK